MNPQKLKIITIIRRLESGYSQSVVMASYFRSSTIYDIKKLKDQLQSFIVSSESMMDLFKWETWNSLNYCNWRRCSKNGLQQCSPNENQWLGLWKLKKISLFMMKWKYLTSAHSIVAGWEILKNVMALESWIIVVKWCLLMLKLQKSIVLVMSDNPHHLIIWHLSGPVGAWLKEFYCRWSWWPLIPCYL